MNKEIEIKQVAIEKLKPYEKNPRKNDKAVNSVAESIKEFGFKVPIVADINGIIITGHTRYKAAKKLGLKTVPVITASDLIPEQVKAFRLVDNKTAELSEWDMELLPVELNEIDIDLQPFGFELIADEENKEVTEDDYNENTFVPARANSGDLWLLGGNRLLVGDSTKQEDVNRLMGGALADLFVTDPPYSINNGANKAALSKHDSSKRNTTALINDNLNDNDFEKFLTQSFKNAESALKPGGAFYIWHASVTVNNFLNALKETDLEIKQVLIWVKNMFVLSKQDYHWKHEPCLYGWKSGAAHCFTADRSLTTVLEFDRPNKSEMHPTMKPIPLFADHIKNSSKKSDIVLDLFGGSGTTLLAAEQLGRKAYLMELEPKFADVIIHRWEQMTGKTAVLEK